MRSLLTSSFVPLTLIGSTVLGAGVAANLAPKQGVVARPAVFQAENEQAKNAAPPVAKPQETPAQAPPYYVQLSSDGLFAGTIMVVDPATGSQAPAIDLNILLMQNGEIKATTKPGVAGVFQAKVAPGQYALIGAGASGYIATGVEILPPSPPPTAQVRATSFAGAAKTGQFLALAVPPADLATVMKLANAYVPSAARTAGPTQLVQAKDFLTAEELRNGSAASGPAAGADSPYTVELQAGGKVLGQLHRFDPQTGKPLRFHHLNAFLVQGDTVPLKAPIAANGNFEFSNVSPGFYSVVAAGGEGFVAFGVRVIDAQGSVTTRGAKELVLPVSFNAKRAEMVTIDGMVIDLTNFPEAIRQLAISIAASQGNNPVNGPAPPGALGAQPLGGGGGGGLGGGGAGAGGGSGLGLLGAALGAAGLGLAAANNDDGGNNAPTSP